VTTAVSIESDPTFSLVIRPSGAVALMLEAFCINDRSSDQAFFSSASCSTWEELRCEVWGPSRVDMNEAVKRSYLQKPNMLKKNKTNQVVFVHVICIIVRKITIRYQQQVHS
jgi:hypothetical protein